MTRNRVWIAAVAGLVLSFSNLVYAQSVTPSTNNSDAMVDVLKTLETKGVITHEEFEALKAKVTKDEQKAAAAQQTAVQQAVQQSAPQLKTVAMPQDETAAENNVTMMSNGVGFHTGRFDVTFTGEVNGFFMHSRPDTSHSLLSCDLCLIDQSSRSSDSVRSGLLPSDLSIKISTQERGWDVAVFFGIWPAIQNNNISGIENGVTGTAAAGTAGIDFRQNFATLGKPHFGTLKIGRDLGLFGQEAILNDMTLLGAGSTNGNNVTPNNVTFGRIGVGYIYTDFLPQVTYTTPSFHGAQGAIGVMQAYDDIFSPFANLNAHGQPMIQGKLTYAVGKGKVKAKFWSNFMTQKLEAAGSGAFVPGTSATNGLCPAGEQNISGTAVCQTPGIPNGPTVLASGNGVRATGVDYGARLDWHGLSVVGYGYNGWGLGLAGLLYDGVGTNFAGNVGVRPSQGWYGQVGYQWHKVFVGFSDGQSNLSLDAGDSGDGSKIRNNTAYVGQFRYGVTKWDNLVAEYTHATSKDQSGVKGDSDSVALGTIVFF